MLGRFGITEIVFGPAVILLLFGSSKIPAIARGLGEGIRNFRAGVKSPDQIEKPNASEEKTPGSEGD
jgi:sec-independent protein translocase protein TatA